MVSTETGMIFDLEELNADAESLRGASDIHIGRVLTARAGNAGLDKGSFRSVLRYNVSSLRWQSRSPNVRGEKWEVSLGTLSGTQLETLKRSSTARILGSLQLIGCLSRIEVTDIRTVEAKPVYMQIAEGIINGVDVSLTLGQTDNHVWARGAGPKNLTEG